MAALKFILSNLLTEAERREGKPAVARLPKGLVIALKVNGPTTVMSLTRYKVYPSEEEFKTILKHFPYPVVTKIHQQKVQSDYSLVAGWLTQMRMNLVCTQTMETQS